MRSSNAEWDFMGRSFLVWSLVKMGLREPQMRERWRHPGGGGLPEAVAGEGE